MITNSIYLLYTVQLNYLEFLIPLQVRYSKVLYIYINGKSIFIKFTIILLFFN